MKRVLITAMALALSTANVFAASSPVAWQGDAVIDSATSACAGGGLVAGSVVKIVLQPKNITGNTANTIVSFNFNALGQFALVLDHGAMPKGTGAAFGNNVSGVLKANVGVKYSAFSQSPATIVANTPDVTLDGHIQDFMFITNCDVSFRAALVKNKS